MPENFSNVHSRTVDFLVRAIDNFGDVGFALDLGESLLFLRPEWRVRFFCDDRGVFDRLTLGMPHPKMEYRNLGEYRNFQPSSAVISFFDFIPPETEGHIEKLLRISYLRFDAGVSSMNATRYRAERSEVVHLVPSPVEWWAGVIVSESEAEPVRNSPKKSFVSVFCYPETLGKIDAIQRFSPIPFGVFGKDVEYVRFDEYERLLREFSGNVVRGENSAVKAMLSGRPFLWDFYKEKNGAHIEKIEDFLAFVRPFFDSEESFRKYATATRAFNSPNFSELDAQICAEILAIPSESITKAFLKISENTWKKSFIQSIIQEIEAENPSDRQQKRNYPTDSRL